jgi:hypothetical protein
LPVHEIYDVSGSVFGFAFEYRYFAKLNDYQIKLNPDLEVPVIVLDAKVETEAAKAAEAKMGKRSFAEGLSGLEMDEELSAKQLRKKMREYEKREIEALPETDTIEIGNASVQVIDSSAYKYDSAFWQAIRPMPLTTYEVKGYIRQDSIAAIPPSPDELERESQDSIDIELGEDGFSANVKRRSKFKLDHLLTGGQYQLSDRLDLKLKGPLQSINFNTVDGFHGGHRGAALQHRDLGAHGAHERGVQVAECAARSRRVVGAAARTARASRGRGALAAAGTQGVAGL